MDDVAETRDEWGADVVVLIVEGVISLGSSSGDGYVYRIGADATRSFAIVRRSTLAAEAKYTLAHELGHIIGGGHQMVADDSTSPAIYGHGYFQDPGTHKCTIMCVGEGRLPFFSSPNHEDPEEEETLGDEYSDVTSLWEAAAPTVAAFRAAWEMSVENVLVEGPLYMEWHDYELLEGSAELFNPDGYVKDCDTDCSYQWYHRVPEGTRYEYGVATKDIYVLWNWTADHEFKLEVSHASGSNSSDPITISYCTSPPCGPVPKKEKDAVLTSTDIPSSFLLHNAYPNPFNPTTQIGFDVPESTHVVIQIFDTLGRFVVELANTEFSAGNHKVAWSAEGQPSGLYFIRMATENYLASQYVTLLK